jgi:carbon-monoxide dehydrogenase small subunit
MKTYSGLDEVTLSVNGRKLKVALRPSDTLLRVLRESLGLTGAKAGCENGDCGACTVLLDGVPVKSCMMLALEGVGHEITTVEGLDDPKLQKAFADCGGFQCGFCTSGFLMNAHALLNKHPDFDDETMEEWLSSNICRCTGYEGIRESLKSCRKTNP